MEVDAPLRVVANENAGTEVLLPLFRQPGMSGATFDAGAVWVMQDLRTLKAPLVARSSCPHAAAGCRTICLVYGMAMFAERLNQPKKPHGEI